MQSGGTDVDGIRLTACLHKFADTVDDLRSNKLHRHWFVGIFHSFLFLSLPVDSEGRVDDRLAFDRIICYLDDFTLKKRWHAIPDRVVPRAFGGFFCVWSVAMMFSPLLKDGYHFVELLSYYTRCMWKSVTSERKPEIFFASCARFLGQVLEYPKINEDSPIYQELNAVKEFFGRQAHTISDDID